MKKMISSDIRRYHVIAGDINWYHRFKLSESTVLIFFAIFLNLNPTNGHIFMFFEKNRSIFFRFSQKNTKKNEKNGSSNNETIIKKMISSDIRRYHVIPWGLCLSLRLDLCRLTRNWEEKMMVPSPCKQGGFDLVALLP